MLDSLDNQSQKDTNVGEVGGWLLFYCITSGIIGPAVILLQLSLRPISFLSIASLFVAGFSAFVASTVWSASPNAIRNLRIYFLFMITLGTFSVLGGLLAPIGAKQIAAGARIIVAQLVWAMYFIRSTRVRRVFGRNLL